MSQAMYTKDGILLKRSLQKAERTKKYKALLLVSPLFIFLFFSFLMPLGSMLWRSIENKEIVNTLPRTLQSLQTWDGVSVPEEQVFQAVFDDLQEAAANKTAGKLATRLNYEYSGARSMITKVTRRIKRIQPETGKVKETLIDIDSDWGEPAMWRVIARNNSSYTIGYYLDAVDFAYDDNGNIVDKDAFSSVNRKLFIRTVILSGVITILCALLAFPIAFLLANLSLRHANMLMILVLLPFWTSLLVRTSTWIVILQTNGVLNDLIVFAGIIDNDQRIQMIYNTAGTIIAMTHILLPFMILPLYSVMKTIPIYYMKAARSLGANSFTAFRKIYFPLTLPGLGAGVVLVFILAIGYYITPALVGGQKGQFITNIIAYHMSESLNWGLAAAISVLLLLLVAVFYLLFNRIIGVDKINLG